MLLIFSNLKNEVPDWGSHDLRLPTSGFIILFDVLLYFGQSPKAGGCWAPYLTELLRSLAYKTQRLKKSTLDSADVNYILADL